MKQASKIETAAKYASALYEDAAQKGSINKMLEDVAKLFEVINQDPVIITLLANPLWEKPAKKSALQSITKKLALSKDMERCLDLMVDNNRIPELKLILEAFQHIYYKQQNIIEVNVGSVKPLSSAQDKKLQKVLEKHLNSKITITYHINPELLGGLFVQYNSNMIDDTIKGKLAKIELFMKEGL